jgi:hypothetical protein
MRDILPDGEIASGGSSLERSGDLVVNGDLESLSSEGFCART